ncbi:MAG: ABC transporter permease [Solibacillus sp.]
MNMLVSLVSRHNKVFFRNRTLVFFSLLSVLILIVLYAIFLQKTQLNAIEQAVPLTPAVELMVNEWMIAGLLSIIAVTTTLGVFSIYVKDLEMKTTADFLTTAASRMKIQLSYIISALIVGFTMSVFALICCEIYLVIVGGKLLSLIAFLKVIGILLISVLLSCSVNLFIVLFIKTQAAFSTLSTIIGTAIGFFCGVYVPMAALPSYVQSMIQFFPISHTTVLLRQVLMEDSITKVFLGNEEAAHNYKLSFGIAYDINATTISSAVSLSFIGCTIVAVVFLSVAIYVRRYK